VRLPIWQKESFGSRSMQRIEAEIEYVDQIELSIETQLVVNYPRPRFAILPISLGLVIERLSGTVRLPQ